MKKILLYSSYAKNDGLTKIIRDIVDDCSNEFQFDYATNIDDNYDFSYYFSKLHHVYRVPRKKNILSFIKAFSEVLKKEDYDAIYIHGNSALMILEVVLAKIYSKATIITHCHNSSASNIVAHRMLKPLFNQLVDKKIGCSKIASDWAYDGKNVITIPNGIQLEIYQFNQETRSQLRNEMGILDNEILIGNVGRMNHQKNHLFLIDVFREYHRKNPQSKLLLIGEGELKEEIIKRIDELELQDDVILKLPIKNVNEYYNAMDVLVMPSLFEGLPLVPLEAQANGLPIILSDHLTPEVYASELVIKENIHYPALDWSKAIEKALQLQRGLDVLKQLEEKGLTKEKMMESIKEVLRESDR